MIRYWSVGLVAACVLSWWLMASFLSQKFSQHSFHNMNSLQSRICHSSKNTSRKCSSCLCEDCKGSTCLQVPAETDWVDRLFRRAIEFLHSSDSMSYNALSWRILQRGKSEKKVESNQLVGARPELTLHPAGSSCWTCAMVGISRSLLGGSGLASTIGQHDLVLRRNWTPVQGFEREHCT
ncbi:uncharacterized protein RHO17_021421 [Thomomys bottae]